VKTCAPYTHFKISQYEIRSHSHRGIYIVKTAQNLSGRTALEALILPARLTGNRSDLLFCSPCDMVFADRISFFDALALYNRFV